MPGIYLGADSIKTVSSLYVGAGGVKTVSAVYVGIGGTPELVWPSWSNGDDLFDPTTESWYWWRNDYNHDWEAQSNNVQGTSDYVSFGWSFGSSEVSARGYGVQIASTTSINYSNIRYLVIRCRPYTTLNASGTGNIMYISVSTSRSSLSSSDSGYGTCTITSYDSFGSRSDSSSRYIIANMTSCTRTGYFKIELWFNQGATHTSSDWARFELYSITVYDSYPSLSYSLQYDCTVT